MHRLIGSKDTRKRRWRSTFWIFIFFWLTLLFIVSFNLSYFAQHTKDISTESWERTRRWKWKLYFHCFKFQAIVLVIVLRRFYVLILKLSSTSSVQRHCDPLSSLFSSLIGCLTCTISLLDWLSLPFLATVFFSFSLAHTDLPIDQSRFDRPVATQQ